MAEHLNELGTVVEAMPGRARVLLVQQAGCKECPAHSLCAPDSGEKRLLVVEDPFGVEPGDGVEISVDGSRLLLASFLLYGLPFLLVLVGIFLTFAVTPADMGGREAIGLGLGSLLAGFSYYLLARRERQRDEQSRGSLLNMRIVNRVSVGRGSTPVDAARPAHT